MVGHGILAFLFGSLNCGGRVGMVGDDIGALADKGQCGIALFTRIEPAVYPDNTDLRSGVDATHAAREGIAALQNFGNEIGRAPFGKECVSTCRSRWERDR